LVPTVIAVALLNAFFAGFHGSAAIVATVISSRSLPPRTALFLAAGAALVGPLVLGTAVANTVGQQLIAPGSLSISILLAGLLAATGWIVFTWFTGVPCSASQALIGGLLGAVLMGVGSGGISMPGFIKILIGLFISPSIGLLAGLALMQVTLLLVQNATLSVNEFFRRAQVFTSFGLALTVSSNDAQKLMGVITLTLVLAGQQATFGVPWWVAGASAAAFALGILSGGYRLIRTLGGRLFKIRPVHAFGAQLAATVVILAGSLGGLPVSNTQVISTAIVGVGSAERMSKIRWQVAANMVTAWVLTIPVTAGLAGGVFWLLKGSLP
jgi:PiT family inorganic phosphate transporter